LSDLEELHSSVAASSNCLSNVQSHTVSGNLVWDLLSATLRLKATLIPNLTRSRLRLATQNTGSSNYLHICGKTVSEIRRRRSGQALISDLSGGIHRGT